MGTQNLYLVQDDDRPMYVLAKSWGEAIRKWMKLIVAENPGEQIEEDNASGIQLVAEANDILL